MAESEQTAKVDWVIAGVIVAVVGVLLAALTVKEGRARTCGALVEYLGQPYFCDCHVTMTLVAFPYRRSADGVSAADACLAGNPPVSVNGTSQDLRMVSQPGTALCADITIAHPRLAKGALIPVTMSIRVPGGLYQDPATRQVSLVTNPAASESDFIVWEDRVALGEGTVTRSRRRLFVVGGDIGDWPPGHYEVAMSNEGIVTEQPIRAEFEVVRP